MHAEKTPTMSKITLYTAVTLDGYIAEQDGGIDFLDHPKFALPGEDYGYAKFYSEVDVVIMGYNTFDQIQGFEGPYPYEGKESIVFSKEDIEVPSFVEVYTGKCSDLVAELKKKGKNVWIVGGGATNANLHESGLIDELYLTYIPVTLGKGVPLFRANNGHFEWKTEGVRTYPNGLVQMHLSKN